MIQPDRWYRESWLCPLWDHILCNSDRDRNNTRISGSSWLSLHPIPTIQPRLWSLFWGLFNITIHFLMKNIRCKSFPNEKCSFSYISHPTSRILYRKSEFYYSLNAYNRCRLITFLSIVSCNRGCDYTANRSFLSVVVSNAIVSLVTIRSLLIHVWIRPSIHYSARIRVVENLQWILHHQAYEQTCIYTHCRLCNQKRGKWTEGWVEWSNTEPFNSHRIPCLQCRPEWPMQLWNRSEFHQDSDQALSPVINNEEWASQFAWLHHSWCQCRWEA